MSGVGWKWPLCYSTAMIFYSTVISEAADVR
jgi:hypothetical protein